MATLTAIFTAQDRLSKTLANAGNQGSKLQGVMNKIGSVGSKAMKGIVTAVAAAGTALVGLGKKAIDVGMSYETSMSQVMATMGIGRDTVFRTASGELVNAYDVLDQAASEMGRTTAFSATQAADALNYLALAGYDATKAATALPTVLYLAGAGGMELAQASDMVTDAMSALQIEATESNLTAFADKLAKTASSSNTSVSQLGDAVLAVGGTAANLKGGVTELAASLGILADAGMKGSEGGTHLRNMINAIQSGRNKDAVNLFAKMGFSAYDAEGNMRSLGDSFKDFNAYLEGMNASQVDSFIRTIFKQTDLAAARAMLAATSNSIGSLGNIVDSSLAETGQSLAGLGVDLEAIAATFDPLGSKEVFAADMLKNFGMEAETAGMIFDGLSSIVNGTGTRFDELTQKIDDSAGACESMYRTMLDNLQGDIDIFNSATEALYLDVFNSVGDTLRNIVRLGSEYMGRLNDAFKEGGFTGLAGELGNVLGDAMAEVMAYAPDVLKLGAQVVSGLLDGIGRNAPQLADAAVDIGTHLFKAVTSVIPSLARAAGNLFKGVISGIVKGFPKMIRGIRDSIYNLFNAKKLLRRTGFAGIIEAVGTVFNIDTSKIEKVQGIFERISGTVKGVFGWLKQTGSIVASAFSFGNKVGGFGKGIQSAFSALVTRFKSVNWSGIWENVKTTAGELYTNLSDAATDAKDKVVTWFKGVNWAGIWEKISGTAGSLWQKLMYVATKAVDAVKNWFANIDWKEIWTKTKDTAGNLWQKLMSVATKAVNAVKNWFANIDWKSIWTTVKDTAGGLGQKLYAAALTAVGAIKNWFQSVNWGDVWATIKDTAGALGLKLLNAAHTAVENIRGWFSRINWSGIWDGITTTFGTVWDGIKTKLDELSGEGGLVGTLAGGLSGAMSTAEGIAGYVSDAVTQLGQEGTAGTLWTSVKEVASSILGIANEIITAFSGGESIGTEKNGIVTAVEGISAAVSGMAGGLQVVSDIIGKANEIGLLGPALESVGAALATYFIGSKIAEATTAVIGFFKALAAGQLVAAALNPYIAALALSVGAIVALVKGAEALAGSLEKDVSMGFDWKARLDSITVDTTNASGGTLKGALEGYLGGLANGLNTGEYGIDQLPVYIGELVPTMADAGFSDFDANGIKQIILDMFADTFGAEAVAAQVAIDPQLQIADTANIGGQLVDAINSSLAVDPASAGDVATQTLQAIESGISGATVDTSSLFDLGADAQTSSAEAVAILNSIGSQVDSGAITTAGQTVSESLGTGIANGLTDVNSACDQVASSIKSAFSGIKLNSVGANIVQGLRNGMQSMFGSLLATARQMASQLKSTIQAGMQVASPSRFTIWVGEMVGQGLAVGLESSAGAALAAAGTLSDGVLSAMTVAPRQLPNPKTMGGYDLSGEGGERRRSFDININGQGNISISGMSKDQAVTLIEERIGPVIKRILEDEIYEGGNDVYDF